MARLPFCAGALALAACASGGGTPAPADVQFPSPHLEATLKFPPGWDSTRSYPLLVALHGYGGDAYRLSLVLADVPRAGFLVAVPQGEYELQGGGWSWFDLSRDRSTWALHDAQTVETVVQLIEPLRTRYHAGPVFVLGFSQGAALAYLVGLSHPGLVTGVAAVAGGLPPIDAEGAMLHAADLAAAKGVRLFVARGIEDPMVHRRTYVEQAAFLRTQGFAVTTFEFAGGHDLPPELVGRLTAWLRAETRRVAAAPR